MQTGRTSDAEACRFIPKGGPLTIWQNPFVFELFRPLVKVLSTLFIQILTGCVIVIQWDY